MDFTTWPAYTYLYCEFWGCNRVCYVLGCHQKPRPRYVVKCGKITAHAVKSLAWIGFNGVVPLFIYSKVYDSWLLCRTGGRLSLGFVIDLCCHETVRASRGMHLLLSYSKPDYGAFAWGIVIEQIERTVRGLTASRWLSGRQNGKGTLSAPPTIVLFGDIHGKTVVPGDSENVGCRIAASTQHWWYV